MKIFVSTYPTHRVPGKISLLLYTVYPSNCFCPKRFYAGNLEKGTRSKIAILSGNYPRHLQGLPERVRIYLRHNAFVRREFNTANSREEGSGGEVRAHNVSLITGINPAKEFIPFLSVSREAVLRVFQLSRATDRGESWFDIFHAHARNICAGMRISSPRRNRRASAFSARRNTLSLSRPLRRALQINVDVPGTKRPDAWYYRSCYREQCAKTKERDGEKEEYVSG